MQGGLILYYGSTMRHIKSFHVYMHMENSRTQIKKYNKTSM